MTLLRSAGLDTIPRSGAVARGDKYGDSDSSSQNDAPSERGGLDTIPRVERVGGERVLGSSQQREG